MAQPLRIEFPGAIYHVTARGNARKAIFRDDADRDLLLDALSEVVTRFGWLCHAYCLRADWRGCGLRSTRPSLVM
jgi:putative transposase